MAKRKASTKIETPPPAPKETLNKSFPASLRRIADSLLAATVWDNINAAKALTDEADLLDPPKS